MTMQNVALFILVIGIVIGVTAIVDLIANRCREDEDDGYHY